MANLSNINNILRVSSSGVGLNKNNTGPSELDIESAGADMIDMTRTGQKTYRFAISGTSAFSLFDVAANEDRLIINSSGNLGLGTTNIRAKLSFPNIVDTNGYDVTSIRLWDNASTIFYGLGVSNSQFNLRAGSADDGFAFWAGESHRMQIQSTSGNVGIGTASPFTNLEVAGSGLDSIIRLYAAGGTANIRTWEIRAVGVAGEGLLFRQVNDANNSYTNRMIIDTDGNVGIGTITPGSKLVVVGGTDTTYNDGTLKVVGSIALNSANNLNPSLNRWALRPRAGGVEGSFDIYDARNSLSRLTIVNSGNVGIGDTSPQGKLEVSQNMSNGAASAFTSPHLRLSALNTTDSTGFVGMTFATSSANNYGFSWGALRTVSALGGMHLRYHANSSVGTDIFNIDYTGNVTIASTRYIRSSSSGGYLTIQGGATFPGGRIDMYGGSNASAGIEFMTGGATASPTLRLRIDGDTDDSYFTGNLGIGTTSPSQKLQVDGGATGLNQGIPPTSGTTQNGILRLTSGSAVYGETFDFGMNVGPTYAWIQATNKGSLAVNYNLALNPNGGNVGIGTTSATTGKLVVTGSPYVITDSGRAYGGIDLRTTTNAGNGLYSAGISFGGSSTASAAISGVQQNADGDVQGLAFFTHGSSGSTADSAERMRITSGGNIDINSHTGATVGYGLRFAAQSGYSQIYQEADTTTTRYIQRFYNPSGNVGNILMAGTSTSYATSSDYRLKEDLQDFAGLDMVSKIPIYDFKWKSDESRSYGVMAHELQKVLPDAVTGEKDAEEMQGVDYSKIVPLLVKSIQELKADNDSLKARIETLENN